MLDKIFGSGLPEVPEPEPRKLFDREQTATLDIESPRRPKVTVTLHTFSAMHGWEMKRKLRHWLLSRDDKLHVEFTLAALAYASIDGRTLDSKAAIDELLVEWQHVRAVFEAVMAHNGIDTSGQDEFSFDWMIAGKTFATSFAAQFEQLLLNGGKE